MQFIRKSPSVIVPIAVFLTALSIRIAYVVEISDEPEFSHPGVDAEYHDYWAWGIASGTWSTRAFKENPDIPSTPYFRPPLYPYVLSLVYAVFGHSYLAPRVIQALLGALGCVLLYFLGLSLFDKLTAAIAGFLMAVSWPLIYFDSELREVGLVTLLIILFLWAAIQVMRKTTMRYYLCAGVLLGLLAIARPNFVLFIPPALIWFFYHGKIARFPRRKLFTSCCAFLLCTLLPISITAGRNLIAGNDFVLVSSNAGINLYIGNNPHSTGYALALEKEYPKFGSAFDYPEIVRHVERIAGREMKHSEVSAYFVGEALTYMRKHPWITLKRIMKKGVLFFSNTEIMSERDHLEAKQRSALLGFLPTSFNLVFSTGVIGLILVVSGAGTGRNPRAGKGKAFSQEELFVFLAIALVVTYAVSYLPFFVTSRYRICILPVLIVFGSRTLRFLVSLLGEHRFRKALFWISATVLTGLLSSINYFGYEHNYYKSAFDRARAYGLNNEPKMAIKEYERALSYNPGKKEAYYNAALHLQEIGNYKKSERYFLDALRLDSTFSLARKNLAALYEETGNPDKAIRHYSILLESDPDNTKIHSAVGTLFLRKKDLNKAYRYLHEAFMLDSSVVQTATNLGITLAMASHFEEAEHYFLHALRLQPDHVKATINLARMYEEVGDKDRSLQYYEQVLELSPNNQEAREVVSGSRSP